MRTPNDLCRMSFVRFIAVLSLFASVDFAVAQSPDRVVWNASGAAGLRVVPKPLDSPPPQIVQSSGIEPLRLPNNLPITLPDLNPSKPAEPPPNATVILCEPQRPAATARRLVFAPQGLLWEPPLAGKREPRLAGLRSGLIDDFSNDTVDTQIGGTFGVFRFRPTGSDLDLQVDIFGVVNSRFSDYDSLVASDYRAGVPLTFRRGPWQLKFAYEHTSTHLGDETIENRNAKRVEFIKDEMVLGLGYTFDDQLRVYGQIGYAFRQFITGDPRKYRYDLGFEWFHRVPTGAVGTPYVAGNLGFRGENGYSADYNLQVGWLWRYADQRASQFRVFGEYYHGRSFYGQLFRNAESFASFGMSIDY